MMWSLGEMLAPLVGLGGVGGGVLAAIKFGQMRLALFAAGALIVGGPLQAANMMLRANLSEANKRELVAARDEARQEKDRADRAIAAATELERIRAEEAATLAAREATITGLRARNRELEGGLDQAISTWRVLEANYANDACLARTDYRDLADGMRQLLDAEGAVGLGDERR